MTEQTRVECAQSPVLVVSSLAAARECADEIARAMRCAVEIADSRKAAMQMLRRGEFEAVVVDEAVAEGDPEGAEQLWRAAGLAVLVQVNFALCSSGRVAREVKAALHRRSLDEMRAREAAEHNLQADIGSALTGIVLELDLLRSDQAIPLEFRERLGQVTSLTADLRKKLVPQAARESAVASAMAAVKLGLRASAAKEAAV